MDYFAGLDVSMEETHVCVVDREGAVIHEVKVPSTPADIKTALAEAPACRRVVFETGRMAPMLHHGLTGCGVPVICIESRQARQALKSFATHKTDRNDARGLAHPSADIPPREAPKPVTKLLDDHFSEQRRAPP